VCLPILCRPVTQYFADSLSAVILLNGYDFGL
jgi:hypothetical protein